MKHSLILSVPRMEKSLSCLPDLLVTILCLSSNARSYSEWEKWLWKVVTLPVLRIFEGVWVVSVSGLDTISICLTSTANHYKKGKMGRFTCNLHMYGSDRHKKASFFCSVILDNFELLLLLAHSGKRNQTPFLILFMAIIFSSLSMLIIFKVQRALEMLLHLTRWSFRCFVLFLIHTTDSCGAVVSQ